MTLVYRAIWQDDRLDLADDVQKLFARWVKERSGGKISIDGPGKQSAEIGTLGSPSQLDVTSEVVEGKNGRPAIVRNSYVLVTHHGERWHTLVRAWNDGSGGWCWVDNSVVGDQTLHARSIDVIAPLIARDLISTGINARVGDFPLSVEALRFSGPGAADRLAEMITTFAWRLPVVVFARSRHLTEPGYEPQSTIIEETARRLAGIAVVVDADEDVAAEMSELVGEGFGVFNGAFRIYARNVDPADPGNAFRHRYFTADRYRWDRKRAAVLAGRMAGPESTLRRPPPEFDAIKERLNRARAGIDNYEKMFNELGTEFDEVKAEVRELRRERSDLQEWEQEAERLEAQLDYAKKLLIVNGICDDFRLDEEGRFREKPPRSSREVATMVRKYLHDRVELHSEALRGDKVMDRNSASASWAQTAWQGFKALYAYGEYMAENPGQNVDFFTWCSGPHNRSGWTRDKTARGESGATMDKRGKTRIFPVSVKLSRNEEMEMVQHLKIQRKGEGDIPRVYFVYSPRTKKVHVGFYGPHELVPNTKSRKR
ncbi:hypothetical protein [Rhodococcus sp. PD04]|nr:hypothetical protein [Rhodococcus sp. PD04]WSE21908.1 hypothetical protein U9J23_19925 [Rhodococcus sp. PD04]